MEQTHYRKTEQYRARYWISDRTLTIKCTASRKEKAKTIIYSVMCRRYPVKETGKRAEEKWRQKLSPVLRVNETRRKFATAILRDGGCRPRQ